MSGSAVSFGITAERNLHRMRHHDLRFGLSVRAYDRILKGQPHHQESLRGSPLAPRIEAMGIAQLNV